jgi:outer membrane protein
MAAKRLAPSLLAAAWLALTGFAPEPRSELPYDIAALLGGAAESGYPPVEPGGQYPPQERDRVSPPAASRPPARPAAAPRKTSWSLSVDASVTGDSNITGGTSLDSVAIDGGSGPVPVPVDPAFRAKSSIGVGASATAGVRAPVSDAVSLAFDAEGYALRYPDEPGANDSSALVAGGVAVAEGQGSGTLQLTAFDRWYAGASASRGVGLRGNWRQAIGGGQHVGLYLDARVFESDWGDALTGRSAAIFLSYDSPLDPATTAAGGVYLRRDWMHDDSFSNAELGAYASLTHYLSSAVTGGLSAGLSRSGYDAPLTYLSPEARRDWRAYASLWLTARKPIALGLYPSLTYTYGRTWSNIAFYRSDRHRLRLGVSRSF